MLRNKGFTAIVVYKKQNCCFLLYYCDVRARLISARCTSRYVLSSSVQPKKVHNKKESLCDFRVIIAKNPLLERRTRLYRTSARRTQLTTYILSQKLDDEYLFCEQVYARIRRRNIIIVLRLRLYTTSYNNKQKKINQYNSSSLWEKWSSTTKSLYIRYLG